MAKKIAWGVLALLLGLVAVLAINTLRKGSRQLDVPPVPVLAVDEAGAAQRLVGLLGQRSLALLLGFLEALGNRSLVGIALVQRFQLGVVQEAGRVVAPVAQSDGGRFRGQEGAVQPRTALAHRWEKCQQVEPQR